MFVRIMLLCFVEFHKKNLKNVYSDLSLKYFSIQSSTYTLSLHQPNKPNQTPVTDLHRLTLTLKKLELNE